MVETVIKHLTEFKQLTDAAIPFRLLNEKGEKNCARAAEKIIKNQVADGLQLWLWNGALYADLCKLERIFMDGMGASEVF